MTDAIVDENQTVLADGSQITVTGTAIQYGGVSVKKLARIVYHGSQKIGEELARNLIEAAEKSVGAHHSEPYRRRIKYLCDDLDVLRRRLKDLALDVELELDDQGGQTADDYRRRGSVDCGLSDRRARRSSPL